MTHALVVTLLPPPDPARDQHGVYRRLRLLVLALARRFNTVEIAHFADPERPMFDDQEYSKYWGVKVRVRRLALNAEPPSRLDRMTAIFSVASRGDFRPFDGPAQRRDLEELMASTPDLVLAHRLPAMFALRKLRVDAPLIFDLDDIEHRVKWRTARQAGATLEGLKKMIEVPGLLSAEREAISRADKTLICSFVDKMYLARRMSEPSRLAVVVNGLEPPARLPSLVEAPTALFLGHYGYEPNAAAARELISAVWPRLRAKIPTARLIVAGAEPERIRVEPGEGVEFAGVALDLAKTYGMARFVCCPIRVGGGTRIKLIEAAAFGKPIVATAVALEGLGFRNERECLIAETPSSLAEACRRVIEDDDLAQCLAQAARDKVLRSHSAKKVNEQIARALDEAMLLSPLQNRRYA